MNIIDKIFSLKGEELGQFLALETTQIEIDSYLKAETEKLIASAHPKNRRRLEGIAWQAEIARKKYKGNPTGCMIEANKKMMASIVELQKSMLNLIKDLK